MPRPPSSTAARRWSASWSRRLSSGEVRPRLCWGCVVEAVTLCGGCVRLYNDLPAVAGVDSVSKKLMMEIAKDRADSRSVVKLLAELIR